MRCRLLSYPPPERIALQGAIVHLEARKMSHTGAAHVTAQWPDQAGFWLVSPAFFSLADLAAGLTAPAGFEVGTAPLAKVLWTALVKAGHAEWVHEKARPAEAGRAVG